jgi:thymidylate kinase
VIAVALIGPDGSGKTTIARRLVVEVGLPARYIYMGVSPDASNRMLPTTRALRALARVRGRRADAGGPPPPPGSEQRMPGSAARAAATAVKRTLRLANLVAEEWYRQLIVFFYKARGTVVILDRHWFADYHAHDIAAGPVRSLDRRIHGFLLRRLYPQPDLVVFLDAPPEVLLARKGEGTVEDLARRRADYLRAGAAIDNFTIVDAARPVDEVTGELAGLIRRLAAARGLEVTPGATA